MRQGLGVAEVRPAMLKQPILPNPLDAQYTAHREEEARRRATKEWLRWRERELGFIVTAAPPVAQDHHEGENLPASSEAIFNRACPDDLRRSRASWPNSARIGELGLPRLGRSPVARLAVGFRGPSGFS